MFIVRDINGYNYWLLTRRVRDFKNRPKRSSQIFKYETMNDQCFREIVKFWYVTYFQNSNGSCYDRSEQLEAWKFDNLLKLEKFYFAQMFWTFDCRHQIYLETELEIVIQFSNNNLMQYKTKFEFHCNAYVFFLCQSKMLKLIL